MKIWHGIAILAALVIANILVQHTVARWDMTDDKRYSISEPTKILLHELDEPIGVTLLLDGELNSGFVRLKKATEEMGDLFFALVNAARLYNVRPDNALEKTNAKFIKRFNYIEQQAKEKGLSLKEMTLDEMEALWQEAKTAERI